MPLCDLTEKDWLDLAYYLARRERVWMHQAQAKIEFERQRHGDQRAAEIVNGWIHVEQSCAFSV